MQQMSIVFKIVLFWIYVYHLQRLFWQLFYKRNRNYWNWVDISEFFKNHLIFALKNPNFFPPIACDPNMCTRWSTQGHAEGKRHVYYVCEARHWRAGFAYLCLFFSANPPSPLPFPQLLQELHICPSLTRPCDAFQPQFGFLVDLWFIFSWKEALTGRNVKRSVLPMFIGARASASAN